MDERERRTGRGEWGGLASSMQRWCQYTISLSTKDGSKLPNKCSHVVYNYTMLSLSNSDTAGEDSEETCTSIELAVVASVTCGATALIVGTGALLIAVIHHCRYKRRFGKNNEALTWEDYKLKDIH